jgi:hypothetical protein
MLVETIGGLGDVGRQASSLSCGPPTWADGGAWEALARLQHALEGWSGVGGVLSKEGGLRPSPAGCLFP